MQRYLIALVLGAFNHGPAVSTAPSSPVIAPAAPAAPARPMAPVSDREIRLARRALRHQIESRGSRRLHSFHFPGGAEVQFSDRRRRSSSPRKYVVSFAGTESAAAESDLTFTQAGRTFDLSPEAVQALRYISRHEGGFDAINTWDSARFSWGFIQFAGGYGLRPALAHFKQMSPELFRELLGIYGVDVELVDGSPEPVFRSGEGAVVRGKDAEQAYGDRPEIIAAFIRAGRHSEVKQRQVETAIREYTLPAINTEYRGLTLGQLLRSPQAIAMLIDRQVQEGNVLRLQRALDHVAAEASDPAAWRRMERRVLDLAVRDASARTSVRDLLRRASYSLNAGGAGEAASLLQHALMQAEAGMTPGTRRESVCAGVGQALLQLRTAGSDELRSLGSRMNDLVAGMTYEDVIARRLADIRSSSLPAPAA